MLENVTEMLVKMFEHDQTDADNIRWWGPHILIVQSIVISIQTWFGRLTPIWRDPPNMHLYDEILLSLDNDLKGHIGVVI